MTWLRLRRAEQPHMVLDLGLWSRVLLFFRAGVYQIPAFCCCQTQHTLGGEQFESVFQVERERHHSSYRNHGGFDHVHGNGLHLVG